MSIRFDNTKVQKRQENHRIVIELMKFRIFPNPLQILLGYTLM